MPPLLSTLLSLLPYHHQHHHDHDHHAPTTTPPTSSLSALFQRHPSQAQALLTTSTTLLSLLAAQRAAIKRLPTAPFHMFLRELSAIQSQHARVTEELNNLLEVVVESDNPKSTRKSKSKSTSTKGTAEVSKNGGGGEGQCSLSPWLQELADAQQAMKRKIVMCNYASRPARLGWREAGKRYWPRVAETYGVLEGLCGKLRGEMEDGLGRREGQGKEEGEGEQVLGGSSLSFSGSADTLRGVGSSFDSSSQVAVSKEDKAGENKRKNVTFDQCVQVRRRTGFKVGGKEVEEEGKVGEEEEDWIHQEVYQEWTTKLTDDGKRTVGSRAKIRRVYLADEVLEGEEGRVEGQ